MRLFNLLNPEELIAGLEFSEKAIRVALFSHAKRGTPSTLLEYAEVELPPGIILGGEIVNIEYTTKAVVAIMKHFKHRVRFVVATIPDDHVWSKLMTFPRTVQGEKLQQAMQVVRDYQLPMPSNKVYVSWEELPPTDLSRAWLAAAPISVVSTYESVISRAGLKLIAVEFMSQSLARAVTSPSPETVLVMIPKAQTLTFSFMRAGKTLFMKTMPWVKKGEKDLEEEAKRMVFFSQGESFSVDKVYEINDLVPRKELLSIPQLKKTKQILSVLGAALRGRRSRDDDASISLLPVGTEEAYAFQRASTFAELLSSTTIAACVFFVGVYLAGWFFILTLQAQLVGGNAVANVPASDEIVALENRARLFSGFLQSITLILSETPARGPFLNKILDAVPAGIKVTEFNFSGPTEQIYLAGSAKRREDFLQLRNNLKNSNHFTDVVAPQSNLELREDIPFSITLKLLNPPIGE